MSSENEGNPFFNMLFTNKNGRTPSKSQQTNLDDGINRKNSNSWKICCSTQKRKNTFAALKVTSTCLCSKGTKPGVLQWPMALARWLGQVHPPRAGQPWWPAACPNQSDNTIVPMAQQVVESFSYEKTNDLIDLYNAICSMKIEWWSVTEHSELRFPNSHRMSTNRKSILRIFSSWSLHRDTDSIRQAQPDCCWQIDGLPYVAMVGVWCK